MATLSEKAQVIRCESATKTLSQFAGGSRYNFFLCFSLPADWGGQRRNAYAVY